MLRIHETVSSHQRGAANKGEIGAVLATHSVTGDVADKESAKAGKRHPKPSSRGRQQK